MTYKVLIVQEHGRHKENAEFRESECLKRAFKRIEGVDAEIWGLNYPNFDASTPEQSYNKVLDGSDAVLVLENYDQQGWLPDFSKTKKPKAFWSIDSHCALGKHVWFAKQSKFDIHFNSTPEYLKHFSPHSQKTLWLPNAFPADLFSGDCTSGFGQRKYQVGFCGNLIADRAQWLDSIDKLTLHTPNMSGRVRRDIFVLGHKMVDALGSYQISLNKSIATDINYRVFESMAAGALLLTNADPPALTTLFEPGKHLLTYTSTQDLADKVQWALANQEQAASIARSGHQEAWQHHTYDHRAKMIIDALTSSIQ